MVLLILRNIRLLFFMRKRFHRPHTAGPEGRSHTPQDTRYYHQSGDRYDGPTGQDPAQTALGEKEGSGKIGGKLHQPSYRLQSKHAEHYPGDYRSETEKEGFQ